MYLNIDINSICTPFLNKVIKNQEITEELLYPFIEPYRNSFITDIMFNIFCQYSATDSEVFTTYADKYLQRQENGVRVDYTEYYKGIYTLNKEYNIDPYDVWIRRCRQVGINPWISIRMNDCHCPDDDACFLRSDFFYEAKEKGWMIGEKYGYFRNLFDYAVPEIRKKMLVYIEEQLARYDIYGIELDFMRDIFCFDYIDSDNETCVKIMNDFIRNTKNIVKKAEEKWDHKIKIAVRLNRDIDQSKIFGFDARSWVNENLVDIIIPSPRWERSDSVMPVGVWKKELPGIDILACIETLAASRFGGMALTTAEMVRGIAGGYLTDGADDIYLYNYFGQHDEKRDKEVYKTCGSLEEIVKHPVRYAVIGQENSMAPDGTKPCNPLPLEVACEEKKIKINTAKIPNDKTVSLILGFVSGSPENAQVLVNGVLCEGFEQIETPKPEKAMEQNTVCYKCQIKKTEKHHQTITFKSKNKNVVISWIEIDVR